MFGLDDVSVDEPTELPLKFEDIVDVYYDKMRPPKNKGFKQDSSDVFKYLIFCLWLLCFERFLLKKTLIKQ